MDAARRKPVRFTRRLQELHYRPPEHLRKDPSPVFSYRHAFHAGNHADVLKHCVLVQLLLYMKQKEKAFWCIDTHAGAASYALQGEYARKNAESETGIARLWSRAGLPAALRDYLDIVRADNPGGTLRYYPGSPWIEDHLLRDHDRLRLFELHSTEVRLLQQHFRAAGPRVIAEAADGFAGLMKLLPPPARRGVALIDPSYEDKNDYARVIAALRGAQERFATGTYAVWYPQVKRRESLQFAERLKRAQPKDWLHVALTVKSPPADGLGLYGSGLFIVNPPYTLPQCLAPVMPCLVELLGQDREAAFTLESMLR
jgi:23S rRNA (adenine2030-N6)-methyltransferase